MDFLAHYFSSSGFMPHGHCFLWSPLLLWTYVLSDSLIGAAYYSIPLALWYFMRRRTDLPFTWVFAMFAVFIFACGTTHLMAIWNIWQPLYWLDAGLKATTATVSVVTAILLWPLIPQALSLPSPRQLEEANGELKIEIAQRRRVELELHDLNQQLEQRVAARTAELETANVSLRREIAERNRAEQSLWENQQLLQSIINNAPTVIYVKHLNGRYLLVNRRFEQLFHVTLAELLDKTDHDLFTKDIADAFRAVDRQVTATDAVVEAEEIALLDDGPHTYISVKFPIHDAAGRIYAVGGISTDITERKRNEQARLESEQSLATTLDSIGDAVIATDLDGRVVRMNPVAEQLTGWRRDEARLRPLGEVFRIISEDTRQPVESPVAHVLREGKVMGLANHTALISRDGGERPIADSGAPIRDQEGNISGVVLVFRDQTEERTLEAMRRRSLQLEIQNRQIQEGNRLKSEFLANMSHELRTPLNAIIGFAELIHDGEITSDMPQHREFVGDILASGRHLLQLINDVLDLSKIEAGKLQFQPEPVDLSALLREVLGILRTTVASKHIRLDTIVDPTLTDITLDAGRFKQVLYNYLSNALKFTPDGGRIEVRAEPEHGTDAFRLEVKDTGPGIAAADLGRLFVAFEQLDAGMAKKHAGTGLGLALTKRLVEAQGGTVGVRSTPGQGSTFHAILPRRALVGEPPLAPQSHPGAHAAAPAVLVIEDNERDQAALVRVLTEAGYAVDTAASGAQALARCQERRFDAITLDLLLPDMSGVEVLRGIRSSGINRDVPVIVVTIVTEKGSVGAFAVHDLLQKPIDSAAVLASLDRAGVLPERSGAILVVDDDANSLKLMTAALVQSGYQVDCVQRGEDALRIVDQAPPLAVVLDLLMPEMDGFQFLDLFRQRPSCRQVPVVVWSMKDLSVEEYARLHATVQGLVTKGLGSAAVVEELRAFLPVERR